MLQGQPLGGPDQGYACSAAACGALLAGGWVAPLLPRAAGPHRSCWYCAVWRGPWRALTRTGSQHVGHAPPCGQSGAALACWLLSGCVTTVPPGCRCRLRRAACPWQPSAALDWRKGRCCVLAAILGVPWVPPYQQGAGLTPLPRCHVQHVASCDGRRRACTACLAGHVSARVHAPLGRQFERSQGPETAIM